MNKKTWLLAGLAALAYNNWLLGIFLNHNLFVHNGSISEFSVPSQPYHWLFQLLDIISGVMMIWLGWRLWEKLKPSRSGRWLGVSIAVLGAANIFDAFFKLPCSETLNPNCHIPVNLSFSSYSLPAHAYSSVVIGACYLILPVAAAVYSYRRGLKPVVWASLIIIVDDLFSLVSVIEDYIRNGGPTTRTSGSGQQIQMLLLGLWLTITVYVIARHNYRFQLATNSTKPVAKRAIPK